MNHRGISEGGIARAGIEDGDDGRRVQLVDDGIVSAGGDGFIERAERQHHLEDRLTARRRVALAATVYIMNHIIVCTASIARIGRDRAGIQRHADRRGRRTGRTLLRIFREAVEITGGLRDAQVILRGDEDFLRGAVHLHQAKIFLVLHHRNEGDTREYEDDGDGDQHLRQREAFSVESFLCCIYHRSLFHSCSILDASQGCGRIRFPLYFKLFSSNYNHKKLKCEIFRNFFTVHS